MAFVLFTAAALFLGFLASVAIAAISKNLGRDESVDIEAIIKQRYPNWTYNYSEFDRSIIGLSDAADRIVVGTQLSLNEYQVSAISSVDVLQDGVTVSSTDRKSQAFGAAVGGLLFGEAGFIAGSLSGKSRSEQRVRSITLRLVVDDPGTPIHTCRFLNTSETNGLDKSSPAVSQAMYRCERFHALISNAMRAQAKLELKSPETGSLSGELARLWDLKSAGALTDDEFSAQKAKVLGGK